MRLEVRAYLILARIRCSSITLFYIYTAPQTFVARRHIKNLALSRELFLDNFKVWSACCISYAYFAGTQIKKIIVDVEWLQCLSAIFPSFYMVSICWCERNVWQRGGLCLLRNRLRRLLKVGAVVMWKIRCSPAVHQCETGNGFLAAILGLVCH